MKKNSFSTNIKYFIYRNLNIIVESKLCSDYFFKLYFGMISFFRKGKFVNLQKTSKFFIFEEKDNFQIIKWCFPITMRMRALKNYNNGLKERGERLAKFYNIDKISFINDDIIIDCGSNLSDLLLYLGTLNINLQYFAIDPGKEEAAASKLNLRNKNFPKIVKKFYEYALGEKNELKTFYYSPESANSSLIISGNYKFSYNVNSVTLDKFALIANINKNKIKLLKLEAEGLEPEVLLGAKNILSKIEYIAADLGPERGLNQKCTVAEVTSILMNNNFEMINFGYPRITGLYRNKRFK